MSGKFFDTDGHLRAFQLKKLSLLSTAKRGDNRIGSVRPSVCPFVCMFVCALPAEPFDL